MSKGLARPPLATGDAGNRLRFFATLLATLQPIFALASLCLVCLAAHAPMAMAQTPLSYDIDVDVYPQRGLLRGRAELLVELPLASDDHAPAFVTLWLYPERLREPPAAMDEESGRWIFPREVERGGIDVHQLRVDGISVKPTRVAAPPGDPRGIDVSGAMLRVPVPRGSARTRSITFQFALRIPRRFGRLGRARGQLSAMAPWYPLLVQPRAAQTKASHATQGAAPRAASKVSAQVQGGDPSGHAFAFQAEHHVTLRIAEKEPQRVQLFAGGSLHRGGFELRQNTSYLPFVAATRLHQRDRSVPIGAPKLPATKLAASAGPAPHALTDIRYVSFEQPYDPPSPESEGVDSVHDLARIDTAGNIARVMAQANATLARFGHPSPPSLTFVAVPSQTELVGTAPGVVLVSDRLFEIFPWDVLRSFHDHALRRGIFRALALRQYAHIEAPAHLPWAADMRAALWNDLDTARRQDPSKSPRDLLGWAAFHPTIDQLLYAPQLPFVPVFFGQVDESEPFRDDPHHALNLHARGRRLLVTLRDHLDERGRAELLHALLNTDLLDADTPLSPKHVSSDPNVKAKPKQPDPPLVNPAQDEAALVNPAQRDAAPRKAPRKAPEGRHPSSIVAIMQSLLPPSSNARWIDWLDAPAHPVNYRLGAIHSKRMAGGHRHRIEIHRLGASIRQRVHIQVIDRDGHAQRVIWDEAGRKGVLQVTTKAPLHDVRIDPEGHLPQSAAHAEEHPRFDDNLRHPWRPPVFQAFDLSFSPSEGTVQGFVDFALRRQYDLKHTFGATISRTVRSTSASMRYVRGFGRKRDNNSRIARAQLGLQYAKLSEAFAEGGVGGHRISLLASVGADTRRYFIDPRQGWSTSAGLRIGGVREDNGTMNLTGNAGAQATYTLPLGLRHVVFGSVGAGWTFGRALASERESLGGRVGLRGYESDELVGRGSASLVGEYRWTALRNLHLNAVHLVRIRELQFALFSGAGMVWRTVDGRSNVFAADVGAGARIHFDYGGIQPSLLAIDVGLPLLRSSRDIVGSTGAVVGQRTPFAVYVSFGQYL